MDGVKSVLLSICLLAVTTGILKMLIPENKFKVQISFLISCIFAISVVSGFDDISVFTSFDFSNLQKAEIVDFSDKLSEQARVEAAKSVRIKVEELLNNNGYLFEKVYVICASGVKRSKLVQSIQTRKTSLLNLSIVKIKEI